MPSNPHIARRAALGTVGLALGCLMTVVEMVFVLVLTLVHKIPVARSGVEALSRTLVRLNLSRLVRYLNFDDHLCVVPAWPRAYSYLGRRAMVGSIGMGIFVLILFGVVSAAIMAWQVVRGEPIGGEADGSNTWEELLAFGGIGLLMLFLAVWGLIGVAHLERALAGRYLGPSEEELLRRRVSELSTTRAGVVEAVNDERRRIERDLHDGVQQRLVALGMLLGRAVRAKDQAQATRLLAQAHEESQQALRDLRDVTWRVYPSALDKDGLHAALEGVADRASVPVRLRYELTDRPELAMETVVYFVASEAVTNALKHGDPKSILIAVTREDGKIAVTVRDDGRGGADPTGSGLSGLASRVAAADGTFHVNSPHGGPTVVTAKLPIPPELPSVTNGSGVPRTRMTRMEVR
jgi:signal transduction histidine kinase